MDCSPPGSSVHAIPQERILEWVAISYSRESSWPRDGIEPRSPAPPTSVGVFFTTVQCELRVLVKRIIWQLKKLFCYEIKTNVKILKVKKWNLKLLMILSHFSDDSVGKQFRLQCRRPGFNSWVRKIPWRRKWQPSPIFLPGESPWTEEPGRLQFKGSQESDMTSQLNHHHHMRI